MGRVNQKYVSVVFCAIFFLHSCTEPEPKKNDKPEKPIVQYIKAPDFDADSAYDFVKKQVEFGYRVPNTKAHSDCGDWLVMKLKQYDAQVVEQHFKKKAYDFNVLNLRNIIGTFNPDAKKRILLAAHWDSRHIADRDSENSDQPFQGANDGASGVGVLLEIVRQISMKQPTVGIDIIFFDGEDYGQSEDSEFPYMPDSWCLGAQYWAANKHQPNYKADYGILLDMVGAKGAKFAKEGVSRYYAPNEVNKIWQTAHRIGYSNYFWDINSPEITDDHAYINRIAKIPMLDIIEYNPNPANGGYFGDYHHTHNDNMDLIDRNTLKAVGQTVMEVIYNE